MPSSRSWLKTHGKRYLSILIGVVLLVGAIAWMSNVFRSKIEPGVVEEETPKATGKTAAVELLPITQTIDVVGTVEAQTKIQVAGQVLATIREVKVRAGDDVAVGQLLVVLDDRAIQAQLREAEAAETGAGESRRPPGRFRALSGNVRRPGRLQGGFRPRRGRVQRGQAQLAQIRQQIAGTKVMLSHTEIKAHRAGIVADRMADPGDLATPGKPLLTLYDPHERELHASVPESLMSDVKLGASLEVRVDAVGGQWQGVVREIVPQAQQASRSVLIKVTLPAKAADRLMVGMFGRLSIPIGKTEWIVAPTAAIRHIGQVDLVQVVGADDRLERRFVRTGGVRGEMTEILAGLNVGEKVALPKEPESGRPDLE